MTSNQDWRGGTSPSVGPGVQIEIKGINGSVTASPATGAQFAVSSVQRGNEDDPADVHIDLVEPDPASMPNKLLDSDGVILFVCNRR